MPKMILLVDADHTLRSQISRALTGHGFEVQENPDGRDVVEQIRAAQPDAIVLCVELPRGSGYAVCSKLRKDDALKHIPVILTSAEASQKAFDDHKKLKNGRADDYLLKPFSVEALTDKIVGLLGAAAPAHGDALGLSDLASEFADAPGEERISLDDIEEISVEDDLAPTSASIPGASDVDMLETAFEKLEDREQTVIHAALGSREHHSADSDSGLNGSGPEAALDPAGFGGDSHAATEPTTDETEALTRALELGDDEPIQRAEAGAPARATPSLGGTTRDKEYFQVKERLAQREKDLLRLREELTAKEKELVEQRDHETQVEHEVAARDDDLQKRDAQIKQLQQKVEALVAGQRKTDKDLTAAREEARTATQRAAEAEQAKRSGETKAHEEGERATALEEELGTARQRLSELETDTERQRSRNDEIEAELAGVRAQLDEANASVEEAHRQLDQHREESESTADELRRRVADLDEERQKHEERVVKAFQRLKSEEQVREKARKALGIALQLLDESGDGAEGSAEGAVEGALDDLDEQRS